MKDSLKKVIRASAITTNSYVAGTVVGTDDPNLLAMDQMVLYVAVTLGSLTSAEMKVEFSVDGGTTYFQETNEVAGTTQGTDYLYERTFTASGNYRIPIPMKEGLVKVSVKGTGTVTNSLVAVTGVFSMNE